VSFSVCGVRDLARATAPKPDGKGLELALKAIPKEEFRVVADVRIHAADELVHVLVNEVWLDLV
jgi:hypothetical protein